MRHGQCRAAAGPVRPGRMCAAFTRQQGNLRLGIGGAFLKQKQKGLGEACALSSSKARCLRGNATEQHQPAPSGRQGLTQSRAESGHTAPPGPRKGGEESERRTRARRGFFIPDGMGREGM